MLLGYYWVDCISRSALPSTALLGGIDIDGSEIFVGRAFHEGDWLPAKVIPNKQVAYVCYNGDEHAKHEFQVSKRKKILWYILLISRCSRSLSFAS